MKIIYIIIAASIVAIGVLTAAAIHVEEKCEARGGVLTRAGCIDRSCMK